MSNEDERSESDGDLLRRMGTDAALWAKEMAEVLNRQGDAGQIADAAGDPMPGGLLHVWLCNAIEAGRGAGYAQAVRDVVQGLPPLVRLQCAYPESADLSKPGEQERNQ